MEKKSFVKKMFLAVFFLVLCVPCGIRLIMQKPSGSANDENRSPAARPEFQFEDVEQYPEEFESYYNDTLPFRDALIRFNSQMNYYGFHSSSNDHVIIGKEGWLFYDNKEDGDPVACYKGTNLFSSEQLAQIAENLLSAQEYLQNRGTEFVVFFAPNKERVYWEMMPEYYGKPAVEYAALQVVDYLREHTDIRIVYPYQEIMELKASHPEILLYHKVDTHWNFAGGYLGSVMLLKELGIDLPSLDSDSLLVEETENTWSDLANMLNMKEDLIGNEKDYIITGYEEHGMINEKWDFGSDFIYHSDSGDPRKLFVYRDSFCAAMSDVLGSQFQESYMCHRNLYTGDVFLEHSPDIFVIELVERDISVLLDFEIEKK